MKKFLKVFPALILVAAALIAGIRLMGAGTSMSDDAALTNTLEKDI